LQKSSFSHDKLLLSDIQSAELVADDKRWSVGRKIGWGIAGAVVLGPLGAVLGGVAGAT
jgi:hypothetical protein